MNIIHCSQGDALWHAQRTGKITASRLIDILPKKTCKVPASRLNYMWEKVTERITFDVADHYVSPWMERGTELEPDARTAYGMEYGVLVDEVGFVVHPTMDFAGASPDGLVLPGAIEIKVPKPETHLRWRDAGVVPPEHEPQCVGVIDACDLEWIDFVSFCPTPMPEELQLFVVRLYRDQKRVDEIQAEMRSFNAEIESTIARLQGGVTQQLRASLEVV